jgi:hypothetical protein
LPLRGRDPVKGAGEGAERREGVRNCGKAAEHGCEAASKPAVGQGKAGVSISKAMRWDVGKEVI